MNEIVCITNGTHQEFAWSGITQHPCRHRPLVDGEEGEPRRASKGFLCYSCWTKLEAALDKAAGLILHLRSTESGSQGLSDRVNTSLTWRLPIPPAWLAADSIMEALGAPPIPTTATLEETKALAEDALHEWRNPEMKVATVAGAVAAVLLYRQVQTALAGWPDAEADRPMPAPLRCPNCQQLTLWYRAPLEYLDDLEVTCGNCGHRQDWETFTGWTQEFVHAFEEEEKAKSRRAKREQEKRQKA